VILKAKMIVKNGTTDAEEQTQTDEPHQIAKITRRAVHRLTEKLDEIGKKLDKIDDRLKGCLQTLKTFSCATFATSNSATALTTMIWVFGEGG